MSQPIWVLPTVVLQVHQLLIDEHGGTQGLRDQGLLDSALARPEQRFFYQQPVSTFELAAAYSYGLAKNHPFLDGNKRIALAIGAIFLELNGYSLNAPEPEAVTIFEQLAAGHLTESSLAQWFEHSSTPHFPY